MMNKCFTIYQQIKINISEAMQSKAMILQVTICLVPQSTCMVCEMFPFSECTIAGFTCNNGACIDGDKKCDGHKDCLEGEDEYSCRK